MNSTLTLVVINLIREFYYLALIMAVINRPNDMNPNEVAYTEIV